MSFINCPKGKIINPETNKCVYKNGRIGKRLLSSRENMYNNVSFIHSSHRDNSTSHIVDMMEKKENMNKIVVEIKREKKKDKKNIESSLIYMMNYSKSDQRKFLQAMGWDGDTQHKSPAIVLEVWDGEDIGRRVFIK
jgi:hypothetical protein